MKQKQINFYEDQTRSALVYAGYSITDKSQFKTRFNDQMKPCIEVTINKVKAFVYKTNEGYKD